MKDAASIRSVFAPAAPSRIPSGTRLLKLLTALINKDMAFLTTHVLSLQSSVKHTIRSLESQLLADPSAAARLAAARSVALLEREVRDLRWAVMNLWRHVQKLVHAMRAGQRAVFDLQDWPESARSRSVPLGRLMRAARVEDVLKGLAGTQIRVRELKQFLGPGTASSPNVAAAAESPTRSTHSSNTNPSSTRPRGGTIGTFTSASGAGSGSSSTGTSRDLSFNPFDPRATETLLARSRGQLASSVRSGDARDASLRSAPAPAPAHPVMHEGSTTAQRIAHSVSSATATLRRALPGLSAMRRRRRSPLPEEFGLYTRSQLPGTQHPVNMDTDADELVTLAMLEEHLPNADGQDHGEAGQFVPLLNVMQRHVEELQRYWKEWGAPAPTPITAAEGTAAGEPAPDASEDTLVIGRSWVSRKWDVGREMGELEGAVGELMRRVGREAPEIMFEPL